MIRSGYACNYKYSKGKYYIKLQEKAKADKRGLWKDNNAVDPWQWRKEKRILDLKIYLKLRLKEFLNILMIINHS
ncbi:thermonuclease family protein [Dysgonomonas gadei]|uniref:TNase-like domain-containing protein n=2 Tax=Dysgonomonas gadei ATCC BAA-286 TaxID=742766 RepID=F5J3D7_9BACT|nr:hypothetical protein [Dysgonomonas gadei]EGJ99722.1 hypothetical protein HMPREF9455_03854 [Dysgonomonas gadei ATCC BAA-286]